MLPYQLADCVQSGNPLLIPAGCVETHGPHMAIGHDTIIVEEICHLIAERTDCAIAPSFDYGPTGYALGGPEDGTIDPDYDSFGRYVKSILNNFITMGFKKTYVNYDNNLDLSAAKADYENGLLTISLPTRPEAQAINVEII